MPQLTPFRGLRYDRAAVADVAAVICPPYDIISPAERERLAARHPANAVHVELPDGYDDAGRRFADWQQTGILRRDERPHVYVYEAHYRVADGLRRARGFLCRLRLVGSAGEGVRAHEHTMTGPKEDRFQLLRAVRANLSPVVLLYEQPSGVAVDELLDALTAGEPALDATADDGVRHLLWTADPARVAAADELLSAAGGVPLTIADGHHRYQTALRYCAEVGGPGADQVLALIVEAHTGGLDVLPTHRLIRGANATDVLSKAAAVFEVEPAASAHDLGATVRRGVVGMWSRAGGALLRARPERIDGLLPAAASAALRSLDVTTLNASYPALLDATEGELTASRRIEYTKDAEEAVAAVEAGAADVAFVLAPTPIEAVLEVAAAGEVMPPKSTYFAPKPATGLVFNVLDA